MDLMQKTLRLALPKGHAWLAPGDAGLLVDGIAISFGRLRTFLRGILAESQPLTADSLLPEWFAALGLLYDSTQTLADRQARANMEHTSVGGQSLDYLQTQVNREAPDITILEGSDTVSAGYLGEAGVGEAGIAETGSGTENGYLYYTVLGYVQDRDQYNRLVAILQRIFPLHLQPYNLSIILSEFGLAEAGIAETGVAEAGYASY